jgi:glycerol-3-phosphate dehydrogenase
VSHGAMALENMELVSFQEQGDVVVAEVVNNKMGETLSLRCRYLVNASGPWVDDIRARRRDSKVDFSPLVDRVAGAHVDVRPAVTQQSFYITADDGRLIFILTRQSAGAPYSRIGTTERRLALDERVDDIKATQAEIDYLKNAVNSLLKNKKIKVGDIIHIDAGVRPLRAQAADPAFQASREHDIVADGRVVHVVGVKLTDFRRVAEEFVEKFRYKIV